MPRLLYTLKRSELISIGLKFLVMEKHKNTEKLNILAYIIEQ